MQTFKKVILASVSFAVILAAASAVIIEPWRHSETTYYQDAKLRDSLAGKLNYLIVGASHGMVTFIPDILDQKLGCNSYNLSSSYVTMRARFFLTEQELNRNPVDTVVLEIAHDALRSNAKEYAEGNSVTFARLRSWRSRLVFLTTIIPFDDWLNLYARDMLSGLFYWREYFRGDLEKEVNYQAKGYYVRESNDITLSPEEAQENYNTVPKVPEVAPDTLQSFQRLVDMCKENNRRVMIVTIPLSDRQIWEGNDWDVFHNWIVDFCQKNGCEYYDFNLLKSRYALWSDQASFFDASHMSAQGAHSLSQVFADVMLKVDAGEDVSSLFYDNYVEMKQDSPYMHMGDSAAAVPAVSKTP